MEVNLVCYGNSKTSFHFVVCSSRQSYNRGEIIELGIWRECSCVFYKCIEGREHIIFQYGFNKSIWMENLRKCSIDDPPTEWKDIIERGVKQWKGKGLKDVF